MMDGMQLFRKLGAGAKFDFTRFKKDAEILQLKDTNSQSLSHENTKKRSSKECSDAEEVETKALKKKRKLHTSPRDSPQHGPDFDSDDELQILGHIKYSSSKANIKKKKKKKSSKGRAAQIKQEQVNNFRNKHKIHIHGSDIPDPVTDFEQFIQDYSLNNKLLANLRNIGYENPTPIQMQVLPVMMSNREVLACAPTGSGKTAAFLIPILQQLDKKREEKGFRALILAPTVELAKQIYRECLKFAEGTGVTCSFLTPEVTKKMTTKGSQNIDILITTPKRLIFLLDQKSHGISLKRVEWLVVDESDKLFEEGKRGFRDQLARIYQACDGRHIRRALFSATFAYEVEQWCQLNLDNLVQVFIGARNSATQTIKQELLFVTEESGKLIAVRDIIRKGIQPPVLIFVQSKERAKELYQELAYDGINIDVIHADRTQEQRDKVIKEFRLGHVWVLICSELMGRGIDFKGVNLVINYDFPYSAISYIHRIGRTGRAGCEGKAITFFTAADTTNLRSIANVIREAGCPVPEYMLHMKKPPKKDIRKMAHTEVQRKSIRTLPKSERRGKKRKSIRKKDL